MDADLRNVLRLLSDITASNIVIEPDVSGRVTLKVEQVPWDQVLDMVLAMNGLGKEQVGNVIRIARQDKLKQEWGHQAEQIRAKQELQEVVKDMGELSTVYLTVNYAQPAEIATKITENKSEKGKVSIDERTSLIIYSDYPARVENARQLLARLDKATPQVLIEARIVTLNSDMSRALGARLGLRSTTPPNRPEIQDFQLNALSAVVADVAIAQVVGKSLLSLDLEISALETLNELRIMAAPRVLTMNNVKATISQGTQIPYLSPTTQASNVLTTEFKDAVLELSVIPHITPDRKVRLEIEAKQDEPSTTVIVGQVPGIDTRKISTELLVDDGNIVVIGGVIRNSDNNILTKTPGLADVPLFGWMFRTKEVRVTKQELLIFISPKIVEASGPPKGTRPSTFNEGERVF
jgi:type IV pilus assembly protein PilQ